jgi:probable phosphoglycerate mutase
MSELIRPLPATGPLWIRHGTCADGLLRPGTHARPNSPLTHYGLREIQRAAQHLDHEDWIPQFVVASPLPRALDTARLLADFLGTPPPVTQPVLTEWRAPDCVLGLSPERYPATYRAWRRQRAQRIEAALPGGESLRAFASRARDAQTLAAELADRHGRVLLVSHRLLIGAIAGLHDRCHEPADLFNFAVRFALSPAQLWAPEAGIHAMEEPRERP